LLIFFTPDRQPDRGLESKGIALQVCELCSSPFTSNQWNTTYSMLLWLVGKPLILIAALLFLHSCHAFHISLNNVENHQKCSRVSSTLGQCLTWIPRFEDHQQQCFVLNESDRTDADKSESSPKHWLVLRRRFSILKYPGVLLKYLQRLGSRKLGRNVDSSLTFSNENGRSCDATSSIDRWAYSAPHVNLTGSWDLITSDNFLKEYDTYLRNLGQPYIVRSVAISIIDRTTEETLQTEMGRSLLLRSINARGVWERTLIGSGMSPTNESNIVYSTVLTADKEPVQAEAWWEGNGIVHHSWLRGVTKYGGGDFESVRYLVDDDSILVCESTFHPYNHRRDPAHIQWRFRRRC
jgi:hypothetical protein